MTAGPRLWPPLIDRFEDFAVAAAVGLGGNLDAAQDIAQEAFALAFRHVGSLDDPVAFPAWLLRLVRTAASRRTRTRLRRPETVPLDTVPLVDVRSDPLVDVRSGPEALAVAASEAARVRAAVQRLPEGERCVVALHYLAVFRMRRSRRFSASRFQPPRSAGGLPAPD